MAPTPEPVIVVAYDPSWPAVFAGIADHIRAALGDLAVAIEHVGSTAVPGLAAKPIIDIDAVVPAAADVPTAITRLAVIGYVHRGDLGIPGREAFWRPPLSPPHHLYVCPAESAEYRRHVRFRDYLRAHPPVAAAYSALKRSLAERYRDDRDAYTNAKSTFVNQVLARADPQCPTAPDRYPSPEVDPP
jgi:GrpB-like predicted nucleotidyltransferase (UPF0157 family)